MRFKVFKMVNGKAFLFNFLLGESKKRQYIATWDEKGKMSGFSKFKKENEVYFLIYDEE